MSQEVRPLVRPSVAAALSIGLPLVMAVAGCTTIGPTQAGKKGEEAYASYVWPAPPDPPKIRLVDIFSGRADLEAESGLKKVLLGASPDDPFGSLRKPYGTAFDAHGRILVTDSALGALFRFDRSAKRVDVFGTRGTSKLRAPMGLCVVDDLVYVADAGLQKIVVFDGEGDLKAVYGRPGELVNPTDAAVSPDRARLYVTDSKAQKVVVFDLKTGKVVTSFGSFGSKAGQFNYPSALAFGPNGEELFVVDQINARVQIFSKDGEYLDELGRRGVGYGEFVRPKGIAVDETGWIYVTDAAFNNVQIFDGELHLLTFVGAAGAGPGEFNTASGVAVRGSEFVIADQMNRRIELFRFLGPKSAN